MDCLPLGSERRPMQSMVPAPAPMGKREARRAPVETQGAGQETDPVWIGEPARTVGRSRAPQRRPRQSRLPYGLL